MCVALIPVTMGTLVFSLRWQARTVACTVFHGSVQCKGRSACFARSTTNELNHVEKELWSHWPFIPANAAGGSTALVLYLSLSFPRCLSLSLGPHLSAFSLLSCSFALFSRSLSLSFSSLCFLSCLWHRVVVWGNECYSDPVISPWSCLSRHPSGFISNPVDTSTSRAQHHHYFHPKYFPMQGTTSG